MTTPAAARQAPPTVAVERDYLADVREEVIEYLDTHDSVVSAQAAEELITRWETGDPDLIDGWLKVRAKQILRDYVYATSLSRGSRRAREEQQGRFAKFAEGHEAALQDGQEAAREFYRYHSVTEGPILVRKPLAALTAKQVQEVQQRYSQAARDNAFYARVYAAVSKRVATMGETATVADVYTPEQLEKMFDRTAGQK